MPRIHKTPTETEAIRNAKVNSGIFFNYSYLFTMIVCLQHVGDIYLFIIVFPDVCEFTCGGHRITFQKLVSPSARVPGFELNQQVYTMSAFPC